MKNFIVTRRQLTKINMTVKTSNNTPGSTLLTSIIHSANIPVANCKNSTWNIHFYASKDNKNNNKL